MAAALDIAHLDVPARGRRAHRRAGRDERLWPARGAGAVALARENRDESAPVGLHSAGQGDVGDRTGDAERSARGPRPELAVEAYRPKADPSELQQHKRLSSPVN